MIYSINYKVLSILFICGAAFLIILSIIYYSPTPTPTSTSTPPHHAEINDDPLNTEEIAKAKTMYLRYCAVCHGEDRAGYAADNAPSLSSQSLMSTGYPEFLGLAILFGRPDTPMAAYSSDFGGPLSKEEVLLLIKWLKLQASPQIIKLPVDKVEGNIALGEKIYKRECKDCHGDNGKGGTGTALGNPAFLISASDHFLHYAIKNGRDGTPMPAFSTKLNDAEINDVTAFLRSQVSGWSTEPPILSPPPKANDYVQNPLGPKPNLLLQYGRYVRAKHVFEALENGSRMVILDARAMSNWQISHIPGAVPKPYYLESDQMVKDLPLDGTWIVAYCACPHRVADVVVDSLRSRGYSNTAVIHEGIFGWISLGYPIVAGTIYQPTPEKSNAPY